MKKTTFLIVGSAARILLLSVTLKYSSKGTLRKESGKLKPIRHNIARMLTRLNEMEKKQ